MYQYLVNLYYRYIKDWGFFGDYKTWQAAASDCEGYDAVPILERIVVAARAVKNGEAEFERDGFLFHEKGEIDNFTFGLNKVVDRYERLSVLDFGGSLGSLYHQHRDFLRQFANVTWCVIEQKHFVDVGKNEFETDILKFEYTIEEAVQKYQPNVVVMSSVLQYLENPYTWLEDIVKQEIPYLWIDRTPFSQRKNDWFLKQIVDKRIYKATYPVSILSLTKFLDYINKHYNILGEFKSLDKFNQFDCEFLGFFCELKKDKLYR